MMNLGDVTNKTVPKVTSARSRQRRRRRHHPHVHPETKSTRPSASSGRSRWRRPASSRVPWPSNVAGLGVSRPAHDPSDIEHPTGYFSVTLEVAVNDNGVVAVTLCRAVANSATPHARGRLRAERRPGHRRDHRLPRSLHDGARPRTTPGVNPKIAAYEAARADPRVPRRSPTRRSSSQLNSINFDCFASAART
jgi:hypothetical protein